MATATLSSKNQIVIPKDIRQILELKKGSRVYIYPAREKLSVIISKTDQDPVEALEGLGADLWKSLGGGEKYIKQERASWGNR